MSSERIETRLDRLAAELAELRHRVDSLESRGGEGERLGPEAAEPPGPGEALVAGPPDESWLGEHFGTTPAGVASLVGRTLLVLAGAYLLRAITDAGVVPRTGGVALGLAYAASWLLMTALDARRERRAGAVFHGLAASLIAYPLIWETTARFELLSPLAGAVLVAAFFVAGLLVAVRWRLPETAWVTTIFALGTAAVLLVGTKHLAPFTLSLLAIAAVTEAVSFTDRWLNVRWPVALTLDLTVLTVALLVSREEGLPESYAPLGSTAAVALLLAVPFLYAAAFAARNLGRRVPVGAFEVVQAAAGLAIGLGGAARISVATQGSAAAIGAVACALGLASYGATFVFADRRHGHERNFYFYSTTGALLVLSGSALIVSGTPLALTWALLSLLVVAAGRRFRRFTLCLHGAIYVAAACAAAGLVTSAASRLFGPADTAWTGWPLGGLAVLGLVATAYAMLAVRRADDPSLTPAKMLPRAISAAAVVWCAAGLAAGALVGMAGVQDTGWVAAVRTATLAVAAVALAWAGRGGALRELSWLVIPVLVIGAVKLLVEDLRLGTPMTLFTSFALYGVALILAPRLLRRRG